MLVSKNQPTLREVLTAPPPGATDGLPPEPPEDCSVGQEAHTDRHDQSNLGDGTSEPPDEANVSTVVAIQVEGTRGFQGSVQSILSSIALNLI